MRLESLTGKEQESGILCLCLCLCLSLSLSLSLSLFLAGMPIENTL